jgi:hypothetical protein
MRNRHAIRAHVAGCAVTALEQEATKVCQTCEEEKPLSAYYTRSTSSDGRRGTCKACHNDKYGPIIRAWQRANPDKMKAYQEKLKESMAPGFSAKSADDPTLRQARLLTPYEKDGKRYCTQHARLMPCETCKKERMH